MQASEGWRIHLALEELDFAMRLHTRNFVELKKWTKSVEIGGDDDENDETIHYLLRLWSQDNRGALEAVMEEASRYLHNFLASASTLIDHTRNHVRDLYGGSDFEVEYQAAVDERLSKNPVCRVVRHLRHYNLHHRFPFVTASMNVHFDPPGEMKSMNTRIALKVETLLEWDRWDGYAKEYLLAAGEDLSIEALADDYMAVIARFYDWLRVREYSVNRQELSRLQAEMTEIRAMEAEFYGNERAAVPEST